MVKVHYKKAGVGSRFGAFIIDIIIILVLSYFLIPLLHVFNVPESLLDWTLLPLYGALFLSFNGATPGKMIFRIKVVNDSYKPLGFGKALLRETIGKLASGILMLGYFWMLLDKRNQTWHDKIAHTFVVQTNRNGSLIAATTDEMITRKRKIAFSLLVLLSILPLLFLTMYLLFLRPFQISGDTMSPNYVNGQYYISQLTQGPFKRGDVIIFKAPRDQKRDFIKRVIALPGDTVMLQNGSVYINKQPIDESQYLEIGTQTYGGMFLHGDKVITVPTGSYFVLGDNRPFSSDSREWGFVPQENIISKVLFCYWQCEGSAK